MTDGAPQPEVAAGGDLAAPYLAHSRWSYGDVLLALVAGVAGAALAAGIFLRGASGPVGIRELAVTLGAQAAATLAAIIWLGGRRGTQVWWRDVGLRIRPRYLWGIVAGIGLQIGVALVVGPLVRLFAPDAPRQEVVGIAERTGDVGSRLLFAALVVVVAPFIEEIVFRGMLLSRLRRAMGPVAAITASAAVFAGIHLLDPDALAAVPGLFLIGLALGWVALRSGDIGHAIFVHAGVNLTGVLVLFLADDLLDAVEAVVPYLPG